MEEESRQKDDILLERALDFLDPEQAGHTSFDRVLAFDFRPLEQLLSQKNDRSGGESLDPVDQNRQFLQNKFPVNASTRKNQSDRTKSRERRQGESVLLPLGSGESESDPDIGQMDPVDGPDTSCG